MKHHLKQTLLITTCCAALIACSAEPESRSGPDPCSSDTECGASKLCMDGVCEARCATDLDCGLAAYCDPVSTTCVALYRLRERGVVHDGRLHRVLRDRR